MTRALESFTLGHWTAGGGPATPLLDATTGETVATIPHHGPSPAAALTYARYVGGPVLRELTFAQRAAVLRALAKHLSGHLDELVALSTRTGATRRDTTVDVDGGIATLAVYAGKAARTLPDDTVLLDGDVEQLGKGGTFAAQHIYTSKLGAALQVNAFNFPVWGMLEKFAPAFLAGMPSVVKPASQTAYLTELAVRLIVDSGLLPEGALQLLCAGPAGLLDGLTAQDTVAFTGSAATALALRTHPAVAGRSVAFNAEADSLNCSVLGPDVTADDPEFALYVDQLVTEMTVKAGQKCTAIRRAFVPAALADAVADAVGARLAAVVVGDPSLAETDMGPVASLVQRDEVRAAVGRLSHDTTLVFGNPETVPVAGADAGRGAFLSPMLLRTDDVDAAAPHEVEAFGPVCTLLPYADLDSVVRAAVLGGGSLAGSVVTRDRAVARRLVTGLAPWHGRLLVLDRDNAAESTGHGIAMPQLVHGGPGRAGGGEELGGLRALTRYMQRTAVQGHPTFLDRVGPGPGGQ
jgi:oxepin-CoA hydrolase/3-oxo-5,6-dehydrosuberyl-CoA semialdehyde dehydrogenase